MLSFSPLFNKKSKFSIKNKLIICKLITQPLLTYDCVMCKHVRKTTYKKLQLIQNVFLWKTIQRFN